MNKPDMTRADALDVLEEVRDLVLPPVLLAELDAAIGVLSSPCEGRKPVAEGWLYSLGYLSDTLTFAKYAPNKPPSWPDAKAVIILADEEAAKE